MSTITDKERAAGKFDAYVPTEEDFQMYMRYSVFRLKLLAWLGDPVAKKILERLK